MKKALITIVLLIFSNTFMTLAWYGHLKMKEMNKLVGVSLFTIILLSWGVAFFEYLLQVPANRIGFNENGGPFTLWQLKVIQEVITLTIFTGFMLFFFKDQPLRWNHLIGFGLLILAVFFLFKK
ncbi:MAG: DMT family protein [Ginsengibacter sp.]